MYDPKSEIHKMTIKTYNYDTKTVEVKQEDVSVYEVAKNMTPAQFHYFVECYINSYSVDYNAGKELGEHFEGVHRTLQGTLYRFCMGILVGLSKQDYTDPRNEVAVKNCKKIAQMLEDGTLKMGYMI